MPETNILITGGAGFIGSNLAHRLMAEGRRVRIFDNLARAGGARNLEWLRNTHGDGAFELIEGDLRDGRALADAARGVRRLYHLAGQVAVTTSVQDPRADFMDNALGTLNALEAARLHADDPVFIFASTNKVYGGMEEAAIVEEPTRYRYADLPLGVPETQPIDFHSPYGCSKGAADQYVRDYHRIYGLRTVVARQSCIYGPRQFGVEDQGWIAWFMLAAVRNEPITICGDGKQVRDVLFVDDLLDAYEAMVRNVDRAAGRIYNVGGGSKNAFSIWAEFRPMLESLTGRPVPVGYAPPRPGDQKVFISDIRKAQEELGWIPKTDVRRGLEATFAWIKSLVSGKGAEWKAARAS